MKKLMFIIPAILLAGCATAPEQVIVRTEQIVIIPNDSLFNCSSVRRFPNPENLTDTQVAELLIALHRNNTNCQRNINAIKMSLQEAKKTAEQNNVK
jgi:uncharacterized lipoprotein YajG